MSIPGLMSSMGGAVGVPKVSSLAYVANATADSVSTITVPASAAAGDLAVLCMGAWNTGAGGPADVAQAGWTTLLTTGPYYGRHKSVYKILEAGDISASVNILLGYLGYQVACMFVFRPDVDITTVTIPSWIGGQAVPGDLAAQSIPASGGNAPLVCIGSMESRDYPAVSRSPAFDLDVDFGSQMRNSYKIYNSSPANHTWNPGNAASEGLRSHAGYIEVE